MDKTVNLIVPGTDPTQANHRQVVLNEKTTVNDLLNQENLANYNLSLGANKAFLAGTDNIYNLVENNGKIYATPPAMQG